VLIWDREIASFKNLFQVNSMRSYLYTVGHKNVSVR